MTTEETTTGQSASGWHRVAAAIRCPQLFAYRELLGIKPMLERIETARGTVLHEMLRVWYRGQGYEDAIATARAMPERYHVAVPSTLALFEGYIRQYPTESFKVLDTEVELEVALAGLPFTRRIDLVVRDGRGMVMIYDHKTAGRPAQRAKSAELDWSLMTQELVMRPQCVARYGLRYGGFILNLIGTHEQEYRRQAVLFNATVLATAARSIHYYLSEINRLADATVSPWEYPRSGACIDRFGVCDYRDLCDYGVAALSGFLTVA